MNITETRIKLPEEGENPRLLAYCGIVLDDDFAVHDLKLIQGNSGVILSMPSRWEKHPCPSCRARNEARSNYCSLCGAALPYPHAEKRVDVFHPVNNEARLWMQGEIWADYQIKLQEGVPLMSGG